MNIFKAIAQSTLWRTIVAVSWSFLGIRKGSEFKEDTARITPLHILVVGVVACFLFVAMLILVVNMVVAK
jgi:hypothetical protein